MMNLNEKYFLAYDLGTTATKAVLISKNIEFIDSEVEQYETLYPNQGYAEHDPQDWWRTLVSTTKRLLVKTGITPEQIAAITFSSQMQGVLPVDEQGTPLMNCMIWLDGRGAEFLHRILFDNQIRHEFRLVYGADHIGVSFRERLINGF